MLFQTLRASDPYLFIDDTETVYRLVLFMLFQTDVDTVEPVLGDKLPVVDYYRPAAESVRDRPVSVHR